MVDTELPVRQLRDRGGRGITEVRRVPENAGHSGFDIDNAIQNPVAARAQLEADEQN